MAKTCETKNIMVLYKNTGKFYNALGIDVHILNYFFGYKVMDNNKAGFPESAFEKVIQKLEKEKISYQIIYTDRNPVIKNYKKLNKYLNIVGKVRAKIDLNKRIDLLMENLKAADEEKIQNIIEKIEACFE